MSRFIGFVGRFTLLHVLTYALFGLLFMNISNYAEAFSQPPLNQLMRPVDDPRIVWGVPMQLLRGALLGAAFFPFRAGMLDGRWGWVKLWALLWVWTGIASVSPGPGTLEGWIYSTIGFGDPRIGLPEITTQMLTFSWLLWLWERRRARRTPAQAGGDHIQAQSAAS